MRSKKIISMLLVVSLICNLYLIVQVVRNKPYTVVSSGELVAVDYDDTDSFNDISNVAIKLDSLEIPYKIVVKDITVNNELTQVTTIEIKDDYLPDDEKEFKEFFDYLNN